MYRILKNENDLWETVTVSEKAQDLYKMRFRQGIIQSRVYNPRQICGEKRVESNAQSHARVYVLLSQNKQRI